MRSKWVVGLIVCALVCVGWSLRAVEEAPLSVDEAAPRAEPAPSETRPNPLSETGARAPERKVEPSGCCQPPPDVPGAPAAPSREPVGGLTAEARKVVEQYELEAAAIQREADCANRRIRLRARRQLKEFQDDYTRAARLDEAVAVRDKIRDLETPTGAVLTDPGTMSQYYNAVGKSFYVRVTGNSQVSIWGTDIYTYDTPVAGVAVHTGLLKPGQTGVVKVTMLGPQPGFHASTRHGMTSYSYGPYSASYRMERAVENDEECEPVLRGRERPATGGVDDRARRARIDELAAQLEAMTAQLERLKHELRRERELKP